MMKTPFWGNNTSLKINNRKNVSHVENKEFERCVDFLTRMIEKYGSDIDLPQHKIQEQEGDDKTDAYTKTLSEHRRTSA